MPLIRGRQETEKLMQEDSEPILFAATNRIFFWARKGESQLSQSLPFCEGTWWGLVVAPLAATFCSEIELFAFIGYAAWHLILDIPLHSLHWNYSAEMNRWYWEGNRWYQTIHFSWPVPTPEGQNHFLSSTKLLVLLILSHTLYLFRYNPPPQSTYKHLRLILLC